MIGVLSLRSGRPWYPFLFLLTSSSVLAWPAWNCIICSAPAPRPAGRGLCGCRRAAWCCWPTGRRICGRRWFGADPWHVVLGAFTVVVLLSFPCGDGRFRPVAQVPSSATSSGAVLRLALLVWMTAYLGLLPSFLLQLRWLDAGATGTRVAALALAIFVPKCCDIGAYFTGRLLGRHPMTPVLSPKKTWEGLARRPGLVGGGWRSLSTASLSVVRGGDLAGGRLRPDRRAGRHAGRPGRVADQARLPAARTPRRSCPASAACSTWSIPSSSPRRWPIAGCAGE